jgi:hypothetical protein
MQVYRNSGSLGKYSMVTTLSAEQLEQIRTSNTLTLTRAQSLEALRIIGAKKSSEFTRGQALVLGAVLSFSVGSLFVTNRQIPGSAQNATADTAEIAVSSGQQLTSTKLNLPTAFPGLSALSSLSQERNTAEAAETEDECANTPEKQRLLRLYKDRKTQRAQQTSIFKRLVELGYTACRAGEWQVEENSANRKLENPIPRYSRKESDF